MPAVDVRRARAETPGCDSVAHFNNAGAALMPQPVLDAVRGHLDREATIGGYEAEAEASERLRSVYDDLAGLIGAQPSEIAVVENATRAWDMAFYALTADLAPGDRILTAQAEYASNYLAYLQVARRTGAVVEVVEDDEHGQLSVAALREALDERVRLVSVTHVPTNGGLVNPAREIGLAANEAGVPFLLDACQSVGQLPVDVGELGCDALAATGRKFLRGPRGTGFLYVREALIERLEPPLIDLHAATWTARDQYRLAARRPPLRDLGGLGRRQARPRRRGRLRPRVGPRGDRRARRPASPTTCASQLDSIDGTTVHDSGEQRCAIVSFTVDGVPSGDVKAALASDAINVSVSPRSHTRLDMEARGLPDLTRASVHYYNTEDEVSRAGRRGQPARRRVARRPLAETVLERALDARVERVEAVQRQRLR